MRTTPIRRTANASTDLGSKAMLVKFHLGNWDAKVYEKDAAAKMAVDNDADINVISARKKILPDSDELAAVNSIGRQAYTFHKDNTLPWFDSGFRILPAVNYMDYTAKMREFKGQFETACHVLYGAYPSLIEKVKGKSHRKLGKLYREDDYPTLSELKRKFTYNITVLPLPQASDFRVSLQADEIDAIKKNMQAQTDEIEKAATQELWTRLNDVVCKLYEALDSGKTFKNTIITNIEQVTDLIPKLNIANDPKINEIRKKVEDVLCIVDPQDLRDDKVLKADVKDDAKEILEMMAAYCG